MTCKSSDDADQACLDGGGLLKSISAIEVGSGEVVFGRPFLALTASATWESGLAAFKSFKCLTSNMGSPLTLFPTLILTVDLDNHSTKGNGPAKLGCNPRALCCFVYTCVVSGGRLSRLLGFELFLCADGCIAG